MNDTATSPSGLRFALGAYLIWGLLPLYLLLVKVVPPFEFVGWRIIFTLPLCLAIVAARRQWPDVRAALGNWRVMGMLCLSALLIGGNWLVYVWAIVGGKVYGASLGYYINPLVNVLLGTAFLGERLSWRQWAAVGLAGVGVAVLMAGAHETLWISLSLAFSFGLYGLIRKRVPVGAVPGLTIESAILLFPAVAIAAYYAAAPAGSAMAQSAQLALSIALSGVVTAVPLLMFALAARRLDLSVLGFVQFLAPTIVFIIGLTVFKEPLRPVQLASFVAIWGAIALFCWDILARRGQPAVPASEAPRKT